MDNQELKIKFEEVQKSIETAKAENKDVSELLKTKYELLKTGFERIRKETSDSKFDKNPQKYSTLLSYLKTMKKTAAEAGLSTDETNALEESVKAEMKKNNLDWLLQK